MVLSEDIPKLYTALAEWLACLSMIAIPRPPLQKTSPPQTAAILAGGLGVLCIIQTFCGMVDGVLWLLGMVAAILVMYSLLRLCLHGRSRSIWFRTAQVFMRAEWMAALEWQLDRYFAPVDTATAFVRSVCFCAAFYGICTALFFLIEWHAIQSGMDIAHTEDGAEGAIGVWLAALLFFTVSNLSYVEIASPFRSDELPEIFNIRAMADLAGMILIELFHNEVARSAQRRETRSIETMLHTQYLQYQQSQENMEVIHRKYHDLKHQIQIIRDENSSGQRLDYLDEIENEIRQLEVENHTGNPVLDTLLTSKSQICLREGIQCVVMADGAVLNGIHAMDLAAIFGNMLDNAVEHEMLIPEREKRMIRLKVSRQGSMISILTENYFEGKLRQRGEEFLTTKEDARYHGYGLKSIRYAVEKYHGIFHAGVEDGWFRVKILIPWEKDSE